jgi:hypothetical protein
VRRFTLEYSDDNKPTRIDAIVISTQHDDFDEESIMLAKIKKDIVSILIIAKYPAHAPLFNDAIKYHINPTGKFVIGGPHGDTGLTGRKSLLIRMEEKELTVVVLSLEKIQVKWIVVPLMLHVILLKLSRWCC